MFPNRPLFQSRDRHPEAAQNYDFCPANPVFCLVSNVNILDRKWSGGTFLTYHVISVIKVRLLTVIRTNSDLCYSYRLNKSRSRIDNTHIQIFQLIRNLFTSSPWHNFLTYFWQNIICHNFPTKRDMSYVSLNTSDFLMAIPFSIFDPLNLTSKSDLILKIEVAKTQFYYPRFKTITLLEAGWMWGACLYMLCIQA